MRRPDAAAGEPTLTRRRGPGLRLRLTLLTTGIVAAVSALLLWLGWMLVGRVAASLPTLPSDMPVSVDGVDVPAGRIAEALGRGARSVVLHTGAVAFALVVVAAAVVSWVLTARVLRPVAAVTTTARRLSAESLDERIELAGPRDEVAELADTFDAMLDRLQGAFEAQRRFVANASHELRTPLAVMRTEVDVTLADPDADTAELRRMADVVRTATRRAEDLVSGLLLLARTEATAAGTGAGTAHHGEHDTVDLATAALGALSAVRDEVTERGLRVDTTGACPAVVRGDAALLERVVGNLVENAVRHNVVEGWLRVEAGRTADTVEFTVASSGPEIADEAVAGLFEPFRRGRGRVSGSGAGLGLSIVRAVAASHGGTVSGAAVPGGGLAVTVRLPAAGTDDDGTAGAGDAADPGPDPAGAGTRVGVRR